MIKGILFDYGGTIDTNGIHWGEVFWMQYQRQSIDISQDVFKAAYSFGERSLALNPYIQPQHNFLDTLRIKVKLQFDYLKEQGHIPKVSTGAVVEVIAADCDAFVAVTIQQAIPVLDELSTLYPLVVVSNFYGNITSVLETYGIRKYFKQIVESAVVGVRKPDPAIFTLGVEALGFPAAECVVIGDSYSKDINPGKTAGCHTIWLKGQGWGDDPADLSKADQVIQRFQEIPSKLSLFK